MTEERDDLGPTPAKIPRLEQEEDLTESLRQQNAALKEELEAYKQRVKELEEENHKLQKKSVNIEGEKSDIHHLFNIIIALGNDGLKHHFQQENEKLKKELSKQKNELRREKCWLGQTWELQQECLVNRLLPKFNRLYYDLCENYEDLKRKIEQLQNERSARQKKLQQLRSFLMEHKELRNEKSLLERTQEEEQNGLEKRIMSKVYAMVLSAFEDQQNRKRRIRQLEDENLAQQDVEQQLEAEVEALNIRLRNGMHDINPGASEETSYQPINPSQAQEHSAQPSVSAEPFYYPMRIKILRRNQNQQQQHERETTAGSSRGDDATPYWQPAVNHPRPLQPAVEAVHTSTPWQAPPPEIQTPANSQLLPIIMQLQENLYNLFNVALAQEYNI